MSVIENCVLTNTTLLRMMCVARFLSYRRRYCTCILIRNDLALIRSLAPGTPDARKMKIVVWA